MSPAVRELLRVEEFNREQRQENMRQCLEQNNCDSAALQMARVLEELKSNEEMRNCPAVVNVLFEIIVVLA